MLKAAAALQAHAALEAARKSGEAPLSAEDALRSLVEEMSRNPRWGSAPGSKLCLSRGRDTGSHRSGTRRPCLSCRPKLC